MALLALLAATGRRCSRVVGAMDGESGRALVGVETRTLMEVTGVEADEVGGSTTRRARSVRRRRAEEEAWTQAEELACGGA